MNNLTYRYRFPEIIEASRRFEVTNYRDTDSYQALVSVNDYQYLKTQHSVPACAADIVDLAVAVSAADRLSICKDDAPNVIEIVLPVRIPSVFREAGTLELLQNVLHWYTGDYWQFSFTKHGTVRRGSELQECLLLDCQDQPAEVALWSGGLDALAGLYMGLLRSPETHFTLFGTGSSSIVHKRQEVTGLAVESMPSCAGRTRLVRVPVKIKKTAGRPKNTELRARGFVFLLLGAVCAYLGGQRELQIYENGIGAINLPFRDSEIGLDHARSVHPISLRDMRDLVSKLLGVTFNFHNPFLFSTKSQMCEALMKDEKTEMIRESISCDRLRRQRPMQCGLCSSCLLRRQSLTLLGLEDKDDYVATTPQADMNNSRFNDMTHLRAMVCQVDTLRALMSSGSPWESLSRRYNTLTDIVDRTAQCQGLSPREMQAKLLGLYKRYVQEWDIVRPIITGHTTY